LLAGRGEPGEGLSGRLERSGEGEEWEERWPGGLQEKREGLSG
jgi:hypothetical protein